MKRDVNQPYTIKHKSGFNWGCLIIVIIISPLLGKGCREAFHGPFIKFNYDARQGEVKYNLNSIHRAQYIYFKRTGKYAKTFEELGWKAEGKNRYSYIMGDSYIPSQSQYRSIYSTKDNGKMFEEIYDDIGGRCGEGWFSPYSYVKDDEYLVIASGELDSEKFEFIDGWQIDEKGSLKNICSDYDNKYNY